MTGPESGAIDAATAEKIFIRSCEFVAGADSVDRIPPAARPEIAFAGRSNVGKSSLVNALTGRRKLARISNTPGRTQQLNFFDIGGVFTLVDMPGYGYAKVSKDKIRNWNRVLETYLKGRASLRLVCVLVDSRHGLKDSDREMMDMLDKAAVPYRIVLTKTDKVRASALGQVCDDVRQALVKRPAAFPEPHVTSAEKGHGIDDLRVAVLTTLEG